MSYQILTFKLVKIVQTIFPQDTVFAFLNEMLYLFPVFLAEYKEMRRDLRRLHSTVLKLTDHIGAHLKKLLLQTKAQESKQWL